MCKNLEWLVKSVRMCRVSPDRGRHNRGWLNEMTPETTIRIPRYAGRDSGRERHIDRQNLGFNKRQKRNSQFILPPSDESEIVQRH